MSRRRRRDRDVLIVLLVLLALGVLAAAVTLALIIVIVTVAGLAFTAGQLHERRRARPGQAQLRQVPEAPAAPLPAAAAGAEHPAATVPVPGSDRCAEPPGTRQPASIPAAPGKTRDVLLADPRSGARSLWGPS